MRKLSPYLALSIVAVGVAILAILVWVCRESADLAEEILGAYEEGAQYAELNVQYPLDETPFPPEIAPPTFRWKDSRSDSDTWVVRIEFSDDQGPMSFACPDTQWTPSDDQWERIKRRSREKWAKVTILGADRDASTRIVSAASIRIKTSADEVGAPLFFREVNLPFLEAVKDPAKHIRWRFGPISSKQPPPIVLEKLPVCGNCHSFSADGSTLAMEVDSGNDKGSYAIAPVEEHILLDQSKIITWSDYRREEGDLTFGLLCQASPTGRYVVGTVKDRALAVYRDELAFSQLFFLVKGILAIYDRQERTFHALPGADDKRCVQTNGTWSPDGKYIVFARSHDEAFDPPELKDTRSVLVPREAAEDFLSGGKKFRFDLYRIPFNDGKGGKAEPLEGASNNGMSNYFAKYSPDGKWIVFCKAESFMLLQPDSELYIIPAEGGKPRRLRCNTRRMNSWHSWSPNGRWLVFSSKANTVYTQLFLTHIDEQGRSSPPVVLSNFTSEDRAANIPEFVNAQPDAIRWIHKQFLDDFNYVRVAEEIFNFGEFERAAGAYQKALEFNPDNIQARVNLADCLIRLGRASEAKPHLVHAIQLQPDTRQAHVNLACVLGQELEYPEAIEHCRKALRIDPEYAMAHRVLGALLLETGQRPEGKEHLFTALRLDPDDLLANCRLADALRADGEYGRAVPFYQRTLQGDPDALPALLGLASIRATSDEPTLRDGKEALKLARRACELTGHADPKSLDTLGAAYAELGEFQTAIYLAERALALAHAVGGEDSDGAIRQRIELYKQQKPCRRPISP